MDLIQQEFHRLSADDQEMLMENSVMRDMFSETWAQEFNLPVAEVLSTITAIMAKVSGNLEEVLDTADLPEGIALKADKGYQSKKNTALLKERKLKNHILKKAYKNKPLTHWEKKFNKLIGKTRFKVERTFGGIKRWFSGGTARYKGIKKMHTQTV